MSGTNSGESLDAVIIRASQRLTARYGDNHKDSREHLPIEEAHDKGLQTHLHTSSRPQPDMHSQYTVSCTHFCPAITTVRLYIANAYQAGDETRCGGGFGGPCHELLLSSIVFVQYPPLLR